MHIDDEAHPAGIVLEERIVETLLGRLARGAARQGAGGGGRQGSYTTGAWVHVVEKLGRLVQSKKRAVLVICESGPWKCY